ncbi:plasmid mobilization protein [Roseateles sp. P5_E11]
MATRTHDFVTVEMRGLKAALVAHAAARRVTVSVVVRDAVARFLAANGGDQPTQAVQTRALADGAPWTKLSIRFTRAEAARLSAAARAAGMSRGAYVVGLVDGVAVVASGGNRPEAIAALIASCAELSTLSRNVHLLTSLLREGDVRRALECRAVLDGVADVVRGHLKLAAGALAGLQPRRAGGAEDDGSTKDRKRPWRKA